MQILLAVTALSGVVLVARILPRVRRLRKRRRLEPARDASKAAYLRLRAPDAWVLDHFCHSITTIIGARPGLRHVSIDLTSLRELDASNAASLRYALSQLEKAGVEASIDGPPSPGSSAPASTHTIH